MVGRETEAETLQPTRERETPRHQCPFYGFSGFSGVLWDQEGNQCALIAQGYYPCQMELKKQTPDWTQCQKNSEGMRNMLEGCVDRFWVFPKEFRGQERECITVRQWMNYIMGETEHTNEQQQLTE